MSANETRGRAVTWSIDRRCMNCGAAPAVAPDLIVERGGRSVFHHQPATDDEKEMAWLAAELCPTRSIRPHPMLRAPDGLYPRALAESVYLCGHNARSSYGAHSYFVRRATGNLLIDAPAFTKKLIPPLEDAGGLSRIVLTHSDDVADADKWASHFGADVYIHRADRSAAPYATHIVDGSGPKDAHVIEDGVVLLPVPGHTEGSIALLLDETHLFTGDSLIWSRGQETLYAVSDYCMYSWSEQRRSLEALAERRFEQIFPGHRCWSPRLSADTMRGHLRRLVETWP